MIIEYWQCGNVFHALVDSMWARLVFTEVAMFKVFYCPFVGHDYVER